MEFKNYFKNIKNKIEQSTEYTLQTDFENLLNEIKPHKTIYIIQESKKTESQTFGKPDFKISQNDIEIGWIETKPYIDSLDKYIETKQLKRYLSVIPNLLFTNYRDFILFRNGKPVLKSTLIEISQGFTSSEALTTNNLEKTKQLIDEFFNAKSQLINKTEKLSITLAKHARYLHDEITELWSNNENSIFKEKLQALYKLFSDTLIESLKPDDFIDAYSQTVTYGLLLSALSTDKKIDKYNFIQFIPRTLSIFEEIFSLLRLSNIPDGISWIIDKIIIILNNTNYTEVQKELSFAYKKGREQEDPYIYFYENFLKAYNNEKRIEKGVYYTPSAVVHFIVKTTQQSLITDLKKSGLDDDSISLLDFASGTGTFLLEAFKTALENIDKGQKNGFIRNKLLKDFFGFELLIAPYTISHLKLSKYLQEQGFNFSNNDRTGIYLTDTLDDTYYQRNSLFPYISDEGEKATKIKLEKKVWVIIGNPPYSNYSKNKKPFIQSLLNDYKKDLNEKKTNIDDDYIKFIRFAQSKIEGIKYSYKNKKETVTGEIVGAGEGIVGIITNNSYLNGITHRAMRKSLLKTFDKIYILNLHGNSIIGEPCKNVFDITVGVSIVLFVKLDKPLKNKEVYYYSTLAHNILKREDKYNFLYNNDLETIEWEKLKPEEPYYWFVEKDFVDKTKYEKGWRLNNIFDTYSVGVGTKVDAISIDFEKTELKNRITDILQKKYKLSEIIIKFGINKKTTWEYNRALKSIAKNKEFTLYDYRPFDKRYIFYNHNFLSRSRRKVMNNFFEKENIAIEAGRLEFIAFVSNIISDEHFGGSKSYKFLLYIYNTNDDYDKNGNGYLFKDETKKDNFTKDFRKFIKKQKLQDYSPEEILGYIYAILYSETYRTKYKEYLIVDFPKIPFNSNKNIFTKLSKLGIELIENHLLKRNYPRKEKPIFAVEGNNKIDSILYNETKQRLYINKEQYFENFQQNTWEYKIGGYQVFDKYLKARKRMILSYNEINHLKKIAGSINKTIKLQKIIDNLCSAWI